MDEEKDKPIEEAVTLEHKEDNNDLDGCDVQIEEVTSDEDLPPAEGGVG